MSEPSRYMLHGPPADTALGKMLPQDRHCQNWAESTLPILLIKDAILVMYQFMTTY